MDLEALVAKTNLKNKDCVVTALRQLGITTRAMLENIAVLYGRTGLCGNGIFSTRKELIEALDREEEIPTIKYVEPTPDAEEERLPTNQVLTMPLSAIEMDERVTEHHLKVLAEAGIATVGDAIQAGDKMLEVPTIGEVTQIRILEAANAAVY